MGRAARARSTVVIAWGVVVYGTARAGEARRDGHNARGGLARRDGERSGWRVFVAAIVLGLIVITAKS